MLDWWTGRDDDLDGAGLDEVVPAPGKQTLTELLPPASPSPDTASTPDRGKIHRYAAPGGSIQREGSPTLAPIEVLFGGGPSAAAGSAAGGGAASALDAAARSPGQPVAAPIRERVEAASGADLSDVRVHDGPESARAADAISAHAYAEGQDVHFAAGQHRPGTADGDRLLAHELAHTIQARSPGGGGGGIHGKLEVSQPGDALEAEADAFADAVMSGGPAPKLGGAGAALAARTIHRDAAPAPRPTLIARVPPGVLLTDGVADPITDALAREIWVMVGTSGYEQFYVNCPADGTPHFVDERGAPLPTARSFGRAQYDTLVENARVQQVAGQGAAAQAQACATAIRAAFDQDDGQEILRQLNLGPEIVRAAARHYDAQLNTLGGRGLAADIQERFPGLYGQAVIELRTAGVTVNDDTGVDLASDPTGASAEQNARNALAMGRIIVSPAGALATPGTSITYSVELPAMLTREGYTVHGAWSCLRDSSNNPAANAWDYLSGPTDSLSWEVTWSEPGVQRVEVGIFGSWPESPHNIWPFQDWQNDPRVVLLQYSQVVLPQQVAVDAAFATSALGDPQQTRALLQQYLDAYLAAATQSGSSPDASVVAALRAQIAAIDNLLGPATGQQRTPIHAVHVATETGQVTPLQVLVVSPDPATAATPTPTTAPASGGSRTWSIIDATNPNDERLHGTYTGTAATDADALRAAIEDWKSHAQYPEGVIRLEVPAAVVQEAMVEQFDTHGNVWADLAEFLQTVGTVAAIVGTIGALVCPPLGVIALAGGVLAATGAAVDMAERHYYRTATAGSDAMDLLTIATTFFSVGRVLGKGAQIMSNGVMRGFVVGEMVGNSAQFVVMNAQFIDQVSQAMLIQDPKQRLDTLLSILGNALLNDGLILISLHSGAKEYAELGRPVEPVTAAPDFLDPARQIEIGATVDDAAVANPTPVDNAVTTGETAADTTPAELTLTGEAAADTTAAETTGDATAADPTSPTGDLVDGNGTPTLAALSDPMSHPEWPRFRDVMTRYGIDEAMARTQWEKVCRGLELQATGGNGTALFDEVAQWMVQTSGVDQFGKPALWAGWPSGALAQEFGFNPLGETALGDALAPLRLFNGDFSTQVRPLWAAISRAFANQLQGDVHIFMARFSADSIVLTDELPIIRQRQLDGWVGEIIFHAIDPASMPNGDTSNAIFLDVAGQAAESLHPLGSELDVQAALLARAAAGGGGR